MKKHDKFYNTAILTVALLLIIIIGLTNWSGLYKVNRMSNFPANSIISFDPMKFSRGSLTSQYSQTFYTNLMALVKANFPGVTHIAVDTPIDSQAEFIAHGSTPAPLTIETFVDMQLDTIHKAGYHALIRSDSSFIQLVNGFPHETMTTDALVARNKAFLEVHAAHIQSGDIVANDYELEGWQFQNGTIFTDTGNVQADTNTFWGKQAAMVKAFATEHNLTNLRSRSGGGYSEIPNKWIKESTFQAQDNVMVYDDYVQMNNPLGLTAAQIIQRAKDHLTTAQSLYPTKYKIFWQEWADIRNSTPNGSIQISDPLLTANMADQVVFPNLEAGVLEGFSFWNLSNSTKEGLLVLHDASGATVNSSAAVTAVLNPKGTALSTVFKKWAGATPIPPDPTPIPPTPTPTPPVGAFNVTKNAKITYDGKGNFTINLS